MYPAWAVVHAITLSSHGARQHVDKVLRVRHPHVLRPGDAEHGEDGEDGAQVDAMSHGIGTATPRWIVGETIGWNQGMSPFKEQAWDFLRNGN